MSTYNPLNEFNSYSYHHFLVIAKDTATADSITGDHANFFRSLREQEDIPGVEVLVNPLSSMKYVINEVILDNVISGNVEATGSTSSSSFSECSLTIIEPNGIHFFNHIYDTYRRINATSSGKDSIWILKTIFIGHNDVPASGSVEYITDIKPMYITPVDVTAEFTEAGGVYNMKFVSMSMGGGMMKGSNSQALTLGSSVSLSAGVSIDPNDPTSTGVVTLLHAVKVIENKIRKKYDELYNKELVNTQMAGLPPPTKVEYVINLHSDYHDPSYTIEANPDQSSSGSLNDIILSARPGDRLDQILGTLFKMCPKMMKESNDPKQWIPRIVTNSTVLDASQNNGYGSREMFAILRTNSRLDDDDLVARRLGNDDYLEFNYTYTGKNVDILTYDMKMNFAVALFERISSVGLPDHGQTPGATSNHTSSAPAVLGGTTVPAQFTNPTLGNTSQSMHSIAPEYVATYEQILNNHVAVETIASEITIRGNPILLNNMVVTKEDIDAALTSDTSNRVGGLSKWLTGPAIAKINIMMPEEDSMTEFRQFWYTGAYRIIQIKHSFISGNFTQELTMIGMPEKKFPILPNTGAKREKYAPDKVSIVGADSEDDRTLQEILDYVPNEAERLPPSELRVSQNVLKVIKRLETYKSEVYDDVGNPAIGYGHNLTKDEIASGIINIGNTKYTIGGTPMTEEQASVLMLQDLKIAETHIRRYVSSNLYQTEFDALSSFVYNIGPGNFSTSTARRALNNAEYEAVPDAMRLFNKHKNKDNVLVVSPGLIRRREIEIGLWNANKP